MKDSRSRAARCVSVSILDGATLQSLRPRDEAAWVLGVALRGRFRVSQGTTRVDLATSDVVVIHRAAPDDGPVEVLAAPGGEPASLLWATFYAVPGTVSGASCSEPLHLVASAVAGDAAIRSVLTLLEGEVAGASAGSRRLLRSLGDALFTYVERRAAGDVGLRRTAPMDHRIARAIELFEANPGARWTLSALAKAAALSRAQFVRRFVAALGAPPLRYVAARRLQLAAELLADGDDSLASVAAHVGYESEFAFSRAFKRFSGVAPGVFRRRMRSRMGVTLALAA